MQIYELSDYTDKDIREMYRRQNAGKALNAKQLRVVYESDDFNDSIYNLSKHPFMLKITSPTQRKNLADRDLLIQTLMLISTGKDNDFTSFRKNDMDSFVEVHGDESLKYIKELTASLDSLNNKIETIKLPATSIPQILYSAYFINTSKKSMDKFVDKLNQFLETYSENTEYKKFLTSGTGNRENVNGRFTYWCKIIETI